MEAGLQVVQRSAGWVPAGVSGLFAELVLFVFLRVKKFVTDLTNCCDFFFNTKF